MTFVRDDIDIPGSNAGSSPDHQRLHDKLTTRRDENVSEKHPVADDPQLCQPATKIAKKKTKNVHSTETLVTDSMVEERLIAMTQCFHNMRRMDRGSLSLD